MDITPILDEKFSHITAFGGAMIAVNGQQYTQSILIEPLSVSELPISAQSPMDNILAEVNKLIDYEVILVGTGQTMQFISPKLRRSVKERTGATIEPMDSAAACRTYNILIAEDRKVAALILI